MTGTATRKHGRHVFVGVDEVESTPTGAPNASRASAGLQTIAPFWEGDFVLQGHLALECGRVLKAPTLHYAVYGQLNEARDNAVLVCHALSGSALAGEWWPGLFGTKVSRSADQPVDDSASRRDSGCADEVNVAALVDLDRDCAICVNLLGSCYGSTGPGSIDKETGRVYGPAFPLVSIRDNVRAQAQLLDSLGIARLKLAIGGSIGGMQSLDWAILFPERVAKAVVIAVAPLGAMGLALNHIQRVAIESDPDWLGGEYLPERQPRRGLAIARQIATLSYKSADLFADRFGRNPNRNGEDPWVWRATPNASSGPLVRYAHEPNGLIGGRFDVAGYLDHQGERFLERFDANAYLAILRTMDTWDPVRGFDSADQAFGRIQATVIFVGIASDWLFPAAEVRRLADAVRSAGAKAEYREMNTAHGHDAFLAEQSELVLLLS
jgi:homoserine O-acetyltransferase